MMLGMLLTRPLTQKLVNMPLSQLLVEQPGLRQMPYQFICSRYAGS